MITGAEPLAELLRGMIRRGDLLPGARLVQEKLAADLQVSRIPLREALHKLAAEGLVETRPQRGMVVAELGRDDVAELFALRLQLEPSLAEEVVRGCRPRDITALEDLISAMSSSENADERATLNYEFHSRIYALSDQRLTLRFVDQLLHLVEPYSRRWVRSGNDVSRIDREHRELVDALAVGDARRLVLVITEHITGARDHVLATY